MALTQIFAMQKLLLCWKRYMQSATVVTDSVSEKVWCTLLQKLALVHPCANTMLEDVLFVNLCLGEISQHKVLLDPPYELVMAYF